MRGILFGILSTQLCRVNSTCVQRCGEAGLAGHQPERLREHLPPSLCHHTCTNVVPTKRSIRDRAEIGDSIERTITVRRNTTKTDAGERVIPLNMDACAAIPELRKRAKLLFGAEPQPDWYLFPHAEGFTKPDPTKPMSGWRTAWRNLTRAILCPACGHLQKPGETCCDEQCKADIRGVKSPLAGLRFHDLRHHAITELAESQANDSIIREIAGHVSPKMLAHYSHARMETKRKALDALSGGSSGGSYGRNSDTNSPAESIVQPQVTEQQYENKGVLRPSSAF